MLIDRWFLAMTGVMHRFGKSVVSLGFEGPIGRRIGSQNNFYDEFKANIPADVTITVLDKSKMAAMSTLCII